MVKFFSELAEAKIVAAQETLPIMVGIYLVYKYGALFPTVAGKIPLPVAVDIELADHPPFFHGKLPDPGADSLAVPCHLAWKT